MAIQRATENTVREAPMSGARLQSANFDAGEIYGRALEGFGHQLGKVVEETDKVVLQYDTAAAKNADTQDAVELARIRAEALNAKGIDAETATERAIVEANEVKARRMETLKGRRGQIYSENMDQRLATFSGQMVEHGIQQADVAARGAALARSDMSLKLAIDGHSDPDIYKNNMDLAHAEFREGNRGASEDQLTAKWREVTSRAHVSIVGMIMQQDPLDPNPHKALDWLDAHKGEILPEHHTEIMKSLNPLLKQDMVTSEFARSQAMGGVLEGGGDYSVEGGITAPKDPLAREDTAGVAGASTAPGETPAGLDPKKPVASATGAKPTVHKPAEPYKNSGQLFDAVLGKGQYRVGSAYGSPRPGGKTHKGTDLPARAGTNIHPPMSGTVIEKGFDKLEEAGGHGGGFFVRVKHPNGTVTGYAHMGGESAFKVGDKVDKDDIIGVVGSSGRSSGPHLHFTVRDAAGSKVNPQTAGVTAMAGTAMADSDGPPLRDPAKTSWKEGDLVLMSTEKDTLGGYIGRINLVAQKEGWSQNKYDLIIGEAKTRAGLNDQMYKQAEDQLWERVSANIAAMDNGDGLTNISQLGGDYGKLSGPRQLQVANMISANLKAAKEGKKVEANGPIYLSYWAMAHDPRRLPGETKTQRQKFMDIDFRTVPDITGGERADLFKMRQDMIDDEKGELAADMSRINSAVLKYSPVQASFLKNPNHEKTIQHNKVVAEVARAVTRQQAQLGRKLNDPEMDDVAKSATTTVYRENRHTTLAYTRATKPDNQASVTADRVKILERMGPQTRARITAKLRREGKKATDEQIAQQFLDLSR